MKVGFAQLNPTVGDLRGNFEKILQSYERLAAAGTDLIATPELASPGSPPQALVFKSRFVPEAHKILDQLHRHVDKAALLVGFVDRNEGRGRPFHNAAALLVPGEPVRKAHKSLLPTYDVFDEDRYFQPAARVQPFDLNGKKIGVTICEDIWTEHYLPRPLYDCEPTRSLIEQGADVILNLSASPFTLHKPAIRHEMVATLARTYHRPIFYCNAVGGNDQLIFDGNSIAVNSSGGLIAQLPAFREHEQIVDTDSTAAVDFREEPAPEELFSALSLGLRDYLRKCNFKSAVLGLSGGVDSAVTGVIAVDALGAENVVGVSMPSPYSSRGSIDDALALARNLGIKFLEIPITNAFAAFKAEFAEIFKGQPENETEENMQPRLRAMTLMALSNKFGHLLLTTGNKSELAVGYCTLYGDMAGGFAVLADVFKRDVYAVSRFINETREGREVIPAGSFKKGPRAELAPNQVDQDTLPPYPLLHAILEGLIEREQSIASLSRHFPPETVRWVAARLDRNEFKRRQMPPGIKLSQRAFGSGRRMPMAARFNWEWERNDE